jgi:hypothetical protein
MTPLEALERRGVLFLKPVGSSGGGNTAYVHLKANCRGLKNGRTEEEPDPRKIEHRGQIPLRVDTCTYCDPEKEPEDHDQEAAGFSGSTA